LRDADIFLLGHLNTPALSEFKLHLAPSVRGSQDSTLHAFLARCKLLESIRLWDMSDDGEQTWMVPTLCAQPRLKTVTLAPCPLIPNVEEFSQEDADSWCPNLFQLMIELCSKVSITDDEGILKRLASMAVLLRRKNKLGKRGPERLVFINGFGPTNFPYDMFKGLDIGRMDIMVALLEM
jgi:hypothetical protein